MSDRPGAAPAPNAFGGVPPHLARLRSVMAPEVNKVRVARDADAVSATDAADRFVIKGARQDAGPVTIHDFEIGTDTLRFAGRKAGGAALGWIDADGDGAADDLHVALGRRSVALVDLGEDGGPAHLPSAEDLFGF